MQLYQLIIKFKDYYVLRITIPILTSIENIPIQLKLLFYQNQDATLSINYQIQRLNLIPDANKYFDRKYTKNKKNKQRRNRNLKLLPNVQTTKGFNNGQINTNKRTRKSGGKGAWTSLAIRKGRDRIRCP